MTSHNPFDEYPRPRPTSLRITIVVCTLFLIFGLIGDFFRPIINYFAPRAIPYIEAYYSTWFAAPAPTLPTPATANHVAPSQSPDADVPGTTDTARPAIPTPKTTPAKHSAQVAAGQPSSLSDKPARAASSAGRRPLQRIHYAFETHSIPVDACMDDRSNCGVIAIPKSLARARGWQSNLDPRHGYWTVYADYFLFDYTYYICPEGIQDRDLCWKTKTEPMFHPFALASTQAQWERAKARQQEPASFWDAITRH